MRNLSDILNNMGIIVLDFASDAENFGELLFFSSFYKAMAEDWNAGSHAEPTTHIQPDLYGPPPEGGRPRGECTSILSCSSARPGLMGEGLTIRESQTTPSRAERHCAT